MSKNKAEINDVIDEEEEFNELPYDDDSDPDWDAVSWSEKGDDDESEAEPEEDESEDSDEAEADQPEADKAEEPTEAEAETDESSDDADQWIELKHLDDPPRKVGKEEAKELAQKGLDYDRIREERDNLKNSLPKYQEMEKFLQEMQGDFDSIEEFMDDTRARVMADSEGISYNDALAKVKSAKSTPPAQPEQSDNGIDVDAFVAAYPDVKAEDIPASVWAEVRTTGDLVGAYRKYDEGKKSDRIAELEREIETLKNNKKNSARSAGSSKSSGATSGKSLIASMWDADDD